jgi:hypothetical protein
LTTKQTLKFWSWFEAEESRLKNLVPKSAEWRDIDRRIRALCDDLPMLEPSGQQRIVEFEFESELGEAECLDRINQIEIEPALSEKDADNSICVGELFQLGSRWSEMN